MDWSGVDYCDVFGLSFWRHPFTAEHPLVSKWCNAKFHQIWSNEEMNPNILNTLLIIKVLHDAIEEPFCLNGSMKNL